MQHLGTYDPYLVMHFLGSFQSKSPFVGQCNTLVPCFLFGHAFLLILTVNLFVELPGTVCNISVVLLRYVVPFKPMHILDGSLLPVVSPL
jgi:hypothetical protein